jgi:two-component system, chemotaxis family, chemotaxis protein CheY
MHLEPATGTPGSSASSERELGRCLRDAPKCTVLVIDDDEEIRSALAEILEISGYDVAVAADGQEGVDLLAIGLAPAAIVLDLMMPRMDGWTFLTVLRADPRLHDVPVLVTSAVAGEQPPGADAWLQKPFDLTQLDRAVARLCAH